MNLSSKAGMVLVVVLAAAGGAALSHLGEMALADGMPAVATTQARSACPNCEINLQALEFQAAVKLADRVYAEEFGTKDHAGRTQLAMEEAKLIHTLEGLIRDGEKR